LIELNWVSIVMGEIKKNSEVMASGILGELEYWGVGSLRQSAFGLGEAINRAGIAQLVEHLLAKQKVASSNLVSRSNKI
jgi:hypothetical protein